MFIDRTYCRHYCKFCTLHGDLLYSGEKNSRHICNNAGATGFLVLHGNRLMTQKFVMEPRISVDLLQKIGRPVFVCVNLDALIHNMTLLADMCANKEAGKLHYWQLYHVILNYCKLL